MLELPEFSLVMLVGISGSGKSSFARQHFLASEVVSSDACRALVGDDENDQSVTADAFDLVHTIAAKRLKNRRLTVLDATHVQNGSRTAVLQLAKAYDALPVAIVLNMPLELCRARNAQRADRQFGGHVLPNQYRQLRQTIKRLRKEGFRQVHVFNSPEELENLRLQRRPLWCDHRVDAGPFDLIGDVHGCCDELEELLQTLGYTPDGPLNYLPPPGRRALFVGDLIDRGPRNLDALSLARNMVAAGHALCLPGNHEEKFLRYLNGKNVTRKHGLEKTLAELEALPEPEQTAWREASRSFIDGLVSHLVLDGGKLVVAHAGMKAAYQNRASGRVRSFALYGDTNGEIDDFGLPVRLDWAADYRGEATVVYGHVPVPEAEWINNTIDIDTGCVFGGKLTALRYPERELVSVPAREVYYAPIRPLLSESTGLQRSGQQQLDDLLDWSEVSGRQHLRTGLLQTVLIEATHSAAALEVLSRFAVDPKWLIYLPPTLSPTETASHPDYLEYPPEALAYYRQQGVKSIVCERKHMGSRAVVVLCHEPEVACRRFGLPEPAQGCIYTRTGRAFFKETALEQALLTRARAAAETAGLFDALNTDWLLLDAELLPWSAKAGELVQQQYAATGSAALAHLGDLEQALRQAVGRGGESATALAPLLAQVEARADFAQRYREAYRGYCWPVHGLDDIQLAPFHLLASEGRVHSDQTHRWHLEQLATLAQADPGLFLATDFLELNLDDPDADRLATDWWLDLTAAGAEGMVVKPLDYVARGPKGWAQPALKCRGREYLRIIYGPDYTLPVHLTRLKKRGLHTKRALALRELALGLEGLTRFVHNAPLREVHACVAGVLALESEPVDPRL
ncbi:MAG: polynucleotide kinase-phosphatase [Candidatus Sericytochromatia bacterium]